MKAIRQFVEERTSVAKDESTESLRDMRTVFSGLKLEDGAESGS